MSEKSEEQNKKNCKGGQKRNKKKGMKKMRRKELENEIAK